MRLLLVLLLSLLSLVSASQQQHISTTPSHPRKTLQFWNEIIDTIKTPSTWIHPSVKYHKFQHLDAAPRHIMDATPAGDNGEKHSYVVQFNTPYTLAIKQQVATYLNTTFGSYIPNDAYMVYIYASQAQALIQDPTINIYISSVQPFKPNNKIHSCVYKPTSDQNTTHLDILLVGEFSAADQLAMGTTWSQGMATGVNATTTAWNITNTNIMEIQVESEAHILHVANFLSTMDETALIQRRTTFRTKNKWGRGEGMNAIGDPNYVAQTGVITFLHPELSGQGEIIGSADTGLDWKSCYFYDQNFPNGPPGEKAWVSALQQPNIVRAVPSDQQHRKVVQYVAFADNIDADGHGTHVQGTLSGVGWNFPTGSILNQFNGMAPAAKLAFFDIGSSATGALSVPTNMDQDLFTWAYAAGARIHSNSWGGMSGGYDLNAQMVDSFIFNHPDMLILFAAGNDGIRGQGSISSPSTAKNGLAIGSAMNSNQAWIQSFCATGFLPTPLLCQVATADPVLFGETSMSAFSSQGPTPDTITSGRLKPEIVLPGEWLLSALNGQDPATSCSNPAAQVLKKDAGTSMATPMAASLAALVRQWLRTGYYPTGTPTIDNSFTPSAALLKAVMIASTRPLTGKFDANDVLFPGGRATVPTVTAPTTLEPTPNYRQGYGRMELQNGIYFPTDPHRMLILQDKANPYWEPSLANNGETKTMTFCVTGTLPSGNTPKVTLVWTDPPVIATVATVVVNNLDLTVQPVGGTVIYQGNQGLPGITLPDAINNVEMVTLPNPTGPTAYTATVTATALGQGPQSFSLVVTGQVKMGVCSPAPVETFQWVSTAWGQCSQACVQTTIGIQKRSVFCVSNLNGGVPDSQCTNNPNLGAKPAETQACNTIPCYSMKYYWVPGAYGPCTQTCGGNKTRANACVGTTGFVTTNDFCSGLTPPTVTTTCAQDPCNNPPSAIFSKWVVSTCTCSAPCNGGTCTRTVACQVNGTVVNDNICLAAGNGPKPIPLQACNTQSCTPVIAGAGSTPTYSWLIGDWSSCSVSCGGGLQTRSVRCRNAAGYLDSDSLCSAIPKPATNATCATDACTIAPVEPATYNWVTGLWGPCNVQTLMMSRWVICSTTSGQLMDVATCESSVGTMPITTQTCTPDANSQSVNSQPPVYQWTAGLFSDPSIWCGPGAGVTTRLPLCIGSSGSVAAMGTQCPSPMPATQQITTGVNATCAKTPQWYVGQYLSDCTNTINPCQGVQQRHVVCVGTNGQVLGDSTQCTGVMPAATRQCAACVKNSSQRITSTWTMLSVIMSMMMICWTTWR